MSDLVRIVIAFADISDAIVTGLATILGAGIALIATWYIENRRDRAEEVRFAHQIEREERLHLVEQIHEVLDDFIGLKSEILKLVVDHENEEHRLTAFLAVDRLKVSVSKVGDLDLWDIYSEMRTMWFSEGPVNYDDWQRMINELTDGPLTNLEVRCRVLLHHPGEKPIRVRTVTADPHPPDSKPD